MTSILPKPSITSEARGYLRDPDTKFIYENLVALCAREAMVKSVSINRAELATKTSEEDEWTELVLRIFVPVDIPRSLDLWDAIGDAIQTWSQQLPEHQQTILADKFAVFVEPMKYEL